MVALHSLVLAGASAVVMAALSAAPPGAGPPGGPAAAVDAGRPAAAAPPATARRDFGWPLRPPPAVVRPFAPGPFRWSAGHRGVDLAGSPGATVSAIGPGTVRFAGTVAGRGVVVVQHGDRLRSTYEPLAPTVPAGTVVATGAALGVLAATGSHCPPAACLHLGAVVDGGYVDPLLLIRGRPAPILLPARRPATPQAPPP